MKRPVNGRGFVAALCLTAICFGPSACGDRQQASSRPLRLATTTSTVSSGLLDVLLPPFTTSTGIKVEVASVGTGKALDLAREGKADVVLAHAREAEDHFIAEGYGINRRDVMYNDYVILGPAADPAGIRGEKNVVAVLHKIAGSKSPFLSRGDNSGTHLKETALWEEAGETPRGDWYVSAGAGMLETLQQANARKGYVLADRGTYLANRNLFQLVLLYEGDSRLWNPYGIIVVNPVKVPGVNYEAATKLADYIVSEQGQGIIRAYGRELYGWALFVPLAIP